MNREALGGLEEKQGCDEDGDGIWHLKKKTRGQGGNARAFLTRQETHCGMRDGQWLSTRLDVNA